MALRTSFKERAIALNELEDDEQRLEGVTSELMDLETRFKNVRLTQQEFQKATLLGTFATDLHTLLKKGLTITKESQQHVTQSFTPLEELIRGEDVKVMPVIKQEVSKKATEDEVVVPLQLVPLILVIHVIKISAEMARGVNVGGMDADSFEKAIMDLMKTSTLGVTVSKTADTADASDTVDIFDATIKVYAAIVDNRFTSLLLEEMEEIPADEVMNLTTLTAFLTSYLGNIMRLLSPVEVRNEFRRALQHVHSIKDVEDMTVYSEQTSKEQRTMINRALKASSDEVFEKTDPANEGTVEQKNWFRKLVGAAGSVFSFLQAAEVTIEKPEIKIESTTQPISVDSDLEEEEEEEETTTIITPPINGVDNVIAPGEGTLFNALYEFAPDSFNESKLPFYLRYKALTYAIYLLKTVEDVAAFMESPLMRVDNEPDYVKLFQILEALSVAFLAQKASEKVKVPGVKDEVSRYEIDIDVREPREAANRLPYRGMTDLDANILSDMYFTYVVPIRNILMWFTAQLPFLMQEGLSENELKAIDRFIESQFRFPFPLFDIGGLSKKDRNSLQEKALKNGTDFVSSGEPLPPVDRSISTNLNAAIRFRMYRNESKSPNQVFGPSNILHLLTMMQARQENVFNPIVQVTDTVQDELDMNLNPTLLDINWYTNMMIKLAKTIMPDAKDSETSFKQKSRYHTIHLFAVQNVLAPEQRKNRSFLLFNPVKAEPNNTASGKTIKEYQAAQIKDGFKPLPSACDACRRKKKEKKEEKHDAAYWDKIKCELNDAITSQDRAALAVTLQKAADRLQKEIENGATTEHLETHISMIREKMKVAAQLGLGGGDVAIAIKKASSACSRCPAHRQKR